MGRLMWTQGGFEMWSPNNARTSEDRSRDEDDSTVCRILPRPTGGLLFVLYLRVITSGHKRWHTSEYFFKLSLKIYFDIYGIVNYNYVFSPCW